MSFPILLFAAGLGTRMQPLTNTRPKPLIEVAGKALIDHALDLAQEAEACPIVVNLHYKAAMIRDHLRAQKVLFSDETEALLETGGGLRKALPLLGAGPVMTMNTDAVWRGPNPVAQLVEAWRPEMEALLLLVEPQNTVGHKGAGDFAIGKDNRLTRSHGAIYTGVQIMRPDVLAEIDDSAFSLNRAWDKIAARGGLFGHRYGGQWCDVGQPESIPLAEAMCDV